MKNKLLQLAQRSTDVINECNIQHYWQADGFKFYNRPLMTWYEQEFDVLAEAVSLQLPSIRKNLNDKHIDLHCNYDLEYLKKLRHRHYYLQLIFDGEHDSTAVLLEAVENGIYIDEIVMHFDNINMQNNQKIKSSAVSLVERYIQRFGKYSFIEPNTEEYKDPWALFKIPEFETTPCSLAKIFLKYKQRRITENSCYIKCSGSDSLLHYKGKWYAYAPDTDFGGSFLIPNIKYFWYEGDNIKSLIKKLRVYRDCLLKNKNTIDENKFLEFTAGKSKTTEDFENNNLTLLSNYPDCVENFYNVFPNMKNRPVSELNDCKFFWFIDIDTLDVYTQKELNLEL